MGKQLTIETRRDRVRRLLSKIDQSALCPVCGGLECYSPAHLVKALDMPYVQPKRVTISSTLTGLDVHAAGHVPDWIVRQSGDVWRIWSAYRKDRHATFTGPMKPAVAHLVREGWTTDAIEWLMEGEA